MRAILVFVVFLSLFAFVSALYNDFGNDSCLTIYSDKKEYFCEQGVCEIVLQFWNNCGTTILDADLGLFLENDLLEKIQFQKAYLWTGTWNDITSILVSSIDARNIPIGKTNFTLKAGWKNVSIPSGIRIIKIVFKTLTQTDGMIIIAGRSASIPFFVSVLDPIFRSAFYDFSNASDYNVFNATIANGYCSLSTGNLEGYCDTNFLQPAPRVIKWYNVNVIKNEDTTKIVESNADETRESFETIGETKVFKTDINAGKYKNYDINMLLYRNSAAYGLEVYYCNEKYVSGTVQNNSDCNFLTFITTGDIGALWTWWWLPVDANLFKDNNKLQFVFSCPFCSITPAKNWRIGKDTNNLNKNSFSSVNDGNTWAKITTGELMVRIGHNASAVMLQYSTDGNSFFYIKDGNLLDVNTASGKIKIRSNLKRYSTSYDGNIDSLDINYTNNRPPYSPTLIPMPDTNQEFLKFQWFSSIDDENNAPILYNIIIGTCSYCNDILDKNTFDLNYDTNISLGGNYYWSVKACDDANELPSQTNCGNFAVPDYFVSTFTPLQAPLKRYYAQYDLRTKDTNRYYGMLDKREETDANLFFLQSDVRINPLFSLQKQENPQLLYIGSTLILCGIIIFIVAVVLWKRKKY